MSQNENTLALPEEEDDDDVSTNHNMSPVHLLSPSQLADKYANSQFQMPRFRKRPWKVKWVKTNRTRK